MKKLPILICIASMLSFVKVASAQIDTVQVGWANSSIANPLYSPVFRLSATSTTTHVRSNILFTQAELQAAGLPTGASIVGIQFRKTIINSLIKTMDYNIYLANSGRTSLTVPDAWASFASSHSKVYSNATMQLPLDTGWVTWSISPFAYTGGALEMATQQQMEGNGGSNAYFSWRVDSTVPADRIEGQTGVGAFPDTLNGTNANYRHRPNTRFLYTMGTLPLKLLSFNAKRTGKDVLVKWTSSHEENLLGYTVERSNDGSSFSNFSYLPATGNGQYGLLDRDAPRAKVYYRLKIMEADGSHSYSGTVLLKAMENGLELQAFPNPFKDRIVIRVNSERGGRVSYQLIAADGRLLLHNDGLYLPAGSCDLPLQVGQLATGMYAIKFCMNEMVKILYLKK